MTMDNNGVVYVLPYSKSSDHRSAIEFTASIWKSSHLGIPLVESNTQMASAAFSSRPDYSAADSAIHPDLKSKIDGTSSRLSHMEDRGLQILLLQAAWVPKPSITHMLHSALVMLLVSLGNGCANVCSIPTSWHLSLSLYQISAKKRLDSASFDCDLDAGVSVEVSI